MRHLIPIALLALALGAACRNEARPGEEPKTKEQAKPELKQAAAKPEAKQPEAKPPEGFQARTLASLKQAGLTVGEFETTAAKPYDASACFRGQVEKLDVMLCEHASEEVAKGAEPKLLEFIAAAGTGAVRHAGAVSLAVADRGRLDPRGQQINKLLRTFVASR